MKITKLTVYYSMVTNGAQKTMMDKWTNELSQLHREDGPAMIGYRHDGSIENELWYLNGLKSRANNLPARIVYNHNGIVTLEQYFVKDITHRTDGPSRIEYENGLAKNIYWAVNGQEALDHPDHYPLTKEEQIEYKLSN